MIKKMISKNKDKNFNPATLGFTLIELLAVIILISFLVILILPRITNSVNNYSKKTDELTLSMIKQGAELYVDDNSSKFLQIDGNKYCVTVNELVKKDYLKDNTEYKGEDITYAKTIEVTYNNGFEYELKDECTPTHYVIEYSGVGNNNYIELVEPGEELKVEFTDFIPPKVVVYQNGVRLNKDKYTYENNVLIIDSVEGNIEIEYREKVYLASLPENTYFKEDAYREKIKSVSFVDYIYEDLDNTLATYDLSANQDESIIGWIDKDYNLYIGSDWSIYSKDLSYTFYNMTAVESIGFNNLNTSEATTMHSMFSGMSNLTSLDLNDFDTSKVEEMQYMFRDMTSLTNLNISNFNTSKVTNMKLMFSGVSSLNNLDLNDFDTSKVEEMQYMFRDMTSLTNLNISNFNTINVTRMDYMFQGCSNLTTLDVSNFNTSKVASMRMMFQGCNNLTTLELINFYTANVTDMNSMFSGCSGLKSIDISSFNTTNVTDMDSMFYGCGNLTSIDVSSFDTSKVMYMGHMFSNMLLLTELNISNFDTSQVTDMKNMFNSCMGLTTLDLTKFNTGQVTNMRGMFDNCIGLKTLDLRSFDTTKVTSMNHMFELTVNLQEVKATTGKWVVGKSTDVTDMFLDSKISSVTLY